MRHERAFQELNRCVSNLTDGRSYEDALTEARRAGLAGRDLAADVEGHGAAARVMILSGLVFGRQLRREQVAVRGITAITGREIAGARLAGGRVEHVATLGLAGPEGAGSVAASVQPRARP